MRVAAGIILLALAISASARQICSCGINGPHLSCSEVNPASLSGSPVILSSDVLSPVGQDKSAANDDDGDTVTLTLLAPLAGNSGSGSSGSGNSGSGSSESSGSGSSGSGSQPCAQLPQLGQRHLLQFGQHILRRRQSLQVGQHRLPQAGQRHLPQVGQHPPHQHQLLQLGQHLHQQLQAGLLQDQEAQDLVLNLVHQLPQAGQRHLLQLVQVGQHPLHQHRLPRVGQRRLLQVGQHQHRPPQAGQRHLLQLPQAGQRHLLHLAQVGQHQHRLLQVGRRHLAQLLQVGHDHLPKVGQGNLLQESQAHHLAAVLSRLRQALLSLVTITRSSSQYRSL